MYINISWISSDTFSSTHSGVNLAAISASLTAKAFCAAVNLTNLNSSSLAMIEPFSCEFCLNELLAK